MEKKSAWWRRAVTVAVVVLSIVGVGTPAWAGSGPLLVETGDPAPPGGAVEGQIRWGDCRIELDGQLVDRDPLDGYYVTGWVKVRFCDGWVMEFPLANTAWGTVDFEHRYGGAQRVWIQVCLHKNRNTLSDRSEDVHCTTA